MPLEIELVANPQKCTVLQDGVQINGVYKIVAVAEVGKMTRVKLYKYVGDRCDKVVIRGVLDKES